MIVIAFKHLEQVRAENCLPPFPSLLSCVAPRSRACDDRQTKRRPGGFASVALNCTASNLGRSMAGLKDKRGFIDKDRLDLSERQAVEYWMKRWGVTREQLTAAHRKVGRLVKDIAAELGKRR
jgi:hypothetical protein